MDPSEWAIRSFALVEKWDVAVEVVATCDRRGTQIQFADSALSCKNKGRGLAAAQWAGLFTHAHAGSGAQYATWIVRSSFSLRLPGNSQRATMMKHPGVPTRWWPVLVLLVTFMATQSASAQLNLNVNRATGAVSISNPTLNPIAINGYSILSTFGALKPADGQWNSLDDQNVGGANAWLESPPGGSVTDLNELNPLGSTTVNASGGTLPLGTPYTHVIPALGINPDHVTFSYNEVSVSTDIAGTVTYSGGTQIANNIILQVDSATGQVQLKNDSPYDVFIDGYAVYSTAGAMQPQNGKWFSLKDRGVTGWEEASPTGFAVSELRQNGSMRLTPGSGYGLGELALAGFSDYSVQFFQPGNFDATNGAVVYGAFTAAPAPTAGVLGDFNNNGSVGAEDYVVWKDAQGTFTILRNDPVGGQIGTAQYNVWKANFGNSTAGGSRAGLTNVPEPGTAVFVLTMLIALAWHRVGHSPKDFEQTTENLPIA